MGKRMMKRLLVSVMAVFMMLTVCIPVMAEEGGQDSTVANASTENPRDSILQVMFAYVDDGGRRTYFTSGTCFLINKEYVLTNKHIFNLNETVDGQLDAEGNPKTLRQLIMETMGLAELKDNDPHLKLFVFANKDMNVEATVHENVQSDAMDFAALRLSEMIYDRQPVVMGDSDTVNVQDIVYAMGFPTDSIENKKANTKDDVSVVDGIISKLTVTGNVDIIEHTAPLNNGNSGGPLLNSDNQVIGINTFGIDKKYYTIQINPIVEALETFGVAYAPSSSTPASASASDPGNEPQPAAGEADPEAGEPDPALVSALEDEISKAKAFDTKGYTEESIQVLNDSIGVAESVSGNTETTNAAVQSATDDLKAAVTGMAEKSGPSLILIVGIAAGIFVILIAVVIIIIVKANSKKNTASANTIGGSNIPPIRQGDGQIPPISYTPAGGAGTARTSGQAGTVPQAVPDGAGETTLLVSGAGETTLLSGAAGGAYLIRKKNGEKIVVNSQNFSIGKERRRVSYCISDNTSVSRCHVIINRKGSDYYAADQGATNFTFVNGVQLSPYQETLLTDKSTLKVSDEEFEFHLP